jgi:hypothetical protein
MCEDMIDIMSVGRAVWQGPGEENQVWMSVMLRFVLAAVLLVVPAAAQAQQPRHGHSTDMRHAMPTHRAMPGRHGDKSRATMPTEPGQGAFAAIQEIVALLAADPKTDWSKVNIERLRKHLVDMSNVTLYARAVAAPVANGVRFTVTGDGAVRDSIHRMVGRHARMMDGRQGWHYAVVDRPDGAVLTVTVADPKDLPKLKALGFIGVMALGMHHQRHHLMIATGKYPYE